MATQIEAFANLVDVSKDTHQGLHYSYKYWKSCFQNGSKEASGSWSSWGLCPQTPRQLRCNWETHIFVAECAEKTLNVGNKVSLF